MSALGEKRTLQLYSITSSARPISVFGMVRAESLGGLQVDVQLHFSGLLDW